MDYQDIEVEISRGLSRALEVRILESPFNRPREFFSPPLTQDELNAFLREWDALLSRTDDESRQERKKVAEQLGRKLFKSIFSGQLQQTFDRCQGAQDTARYGLRLRLSFGEPEKFPAEVIRLPWELLYQKQFGTARFLCQGASTQVVRYLDCLEGIQPLETDPPIKVLAVLCAPQDQRSINIEGYEEGLREALFQSRLVNIDFLRHATIKRTIQRLDQGGYHVLHFLGHGNYRTKKGGGVLYFETKNRKSCPVTGKRLANQLDGINPLRLVVLNTCLGARMLGDKDQAPFTGTAAALISIGLPAVVAMQFPISVAAARAFSRTFYEHIAQLKPLEHAMAGARAAIERHTKEDAFEWATPVLFLRAKDGYILKYNNENKKPLSKKRITILTLRDIGKEAMDETDLQVDLEHCFEGRYVRDASFWNGRIKETLELKLGEALPDGMHFEVDLAAPNSVAFAAGYLMQVKEGSQISVCQRGRRGLTVLDPLEEPPQGAPKWKEEAPVSKEVPLVEGTDSIAVLISITDDVQPAVAAYLKKRALEPAPPMIEHVIHADIEAEPGTRHLSIRNGGHAYRLAATLVERIHNFNSGQERRKQVHIFAAAPNAFLFFLGQLAHRLGHIQLYEYDFEARRSGTYEPSITLAVSE